MGVAQRGRAGWRPAPAGRRRRQRRREPGRGGRPRRPRPGRAAIAFQLLVYPVLDAAGDTGSWGEFAEGHYLTAAGMRWYWDHYLGGADGGAPDASPPRAAFVGGFPRPW